MKYLLIISLFSGILNLFFDDRDATAKNCGAAVVKAADFIRKKYKVNPCGVGGKRDKTNTKKEEVALSIQCRRALEINEARRLVLAIFQDLYDSLIASNKEKPFFVDNPSVGNIDLVIFFSLPDGHDNYHPTIGTASLRDNELCMRTDDPEDIYGDKAVIRETYEQALAIVEGRLPEPVYPELQP